MEGNFIKYSKGPKFVTSSWQTIYQAGSHCKKTQLLIAIKPCLNFPNYPKIQGRVISLDLRVIRMNNLPSLTESWCHNFTHWVDVRNIHEFVSLEVKKYDI